MSNREEPEFKNKVDWIWLNKSVIVILLIYMSYCFKGRGVFTSGTDALVAILSLVAQFLIQDLSFNLRIGLEFVSWDHLLNKYSASVPGVTAPRPNNQ